MKRRHFIGAVSALFAAPAVASVTPVPAPPPIPQVKRMDGCAFVLGVATETVHAGEFVQIQTRGPAQVKISHR